MSRFPLGIKTRIEIKHIIGFQTDVKRSTTVIDEIHWVLNRNQIEILTNEVKLLGPYHNDCGELRFMHNATCLVYEHQITDLFVIYSKLGFRCKIHNTIPGVVFAELWHKDTSI